MKNIFLTAILSASLLAGGCAANESKPIGEASKATEPSAVRSAPESYEVSETPKAPDISETEDTLPDTIPNNPLKIDERLQSAVRDVYSGIEIDAFVRERKAILPGFPVPVTVMVRNTGTHTVDYVHGSGGYDTPDAVFITADELQPVLPKDRLGMVIMDFQVKELNPGDELQFTMYVMAIKPDANFDAHTVDLYMDSEQYIVEKDWGDLQKEFPDLVPAEPGLYPIRAYFSYYLRDASGASNFTEEPSGYAQCDFQIAVS